MFDIGTKYFMDLIRARHHQSLPLTPNWKLFYLQNIPLQLRSNIPRENRARFPLWTRTNHPIDINS